MKIILAGGGTGGHLFPGIALAQELSHRRPAPMSEATSGDAENNILFLCTNRQFDAKQLFRYGFKYYALPSPRLSLSPLFVINMIRAFYQAGKQLCSFRPDAESQRSPDRSVGIVVGLGGYGSFAPLVIALLKGIPVVLLEQNLLPGRITRLLSPFAKRVFCQWQDTKRYLGRRNNIVHSGSPIRQEILGATEERKNQETKKQAVRKLFGSSVLSSFSSSVRILAIIGGSQGAESINRAVINSELCTPHSELGIIHLTGEKDFYSVKSAYEKAGIKAFVAPFYENMAEVYQTADLVLSRAGGIAIAEMTAFGLPMVLVPYPYAADDHQTYNAREVARAGAGIMIRQSELLDRMGEVIGLLTDQVALKRMSENSRQMARPYAGPQIAQYIQNTK